jgi:riboflavin synthase
MFTGIIKEQGRLAEDPRPSGQGGIRLVLEHSPELSQRLELGASLAVNGVCLTLTEMEPGRSTVELAPETVRLTTLGELREGHPVNLEGALRAGEALGGHWVQGHVDTTLDVVGRRELEDHRELTFAVPEDHEVYIAQKGSVTLDGVSLTVCHREPGRFQVALIPHTLEVTTLGNLEVGDRVNFEVDVLAKYVEQALAARGLGAA